MLFVCLSVGEVVPGSPLLAAAAIQENSRGRGGERERERETSARDRKAALPSSDLHRVSEVPRWEYKATHSVSS
ncbi:hypothetical protein LX32DRAFT_643449 [Colletotrichum zoysiae]|uniref:Uncharacterized protein n=1 Tax=Colletotrichum zoysiae TaxID=1216348 RepID=A0AAD9H8Y0_9PEZI|nr:hypothetical protein LX32DRAFT_643449 [Colletotrichum zoysiae]